jgi:hypothetical protein
MNFCQYCGAPKHAEITGFYDQTTGQPETREVCSAQPCAHNGHETPPQPRDYPIWRMFFPERCVRCGKRVWSEE